MLQQLCFYGFAAWLLFSATMVVTSRNTVKSALFLVMTFFACAAIWIMLEAEVLALVLIFVYVGAVMTLFLFVVMMLNLSDARKGRGYVKYLPFGLLTIAILAGLLIYVISPQHFALVSAAIPPAEPANYSNVAELGMVLYTTYAYPFILASVLLLTAIVAAITLAFRGRKPNTKSQKITQQIKVRREDRVRLVDMPSEMVLPSATKDLP